jgi:hypothetical protein
MSSRSGPDRAAEESMLRAYEARRASIPAHREVSAAVEAEIARLGREDRQEVERLIRELENPNRSATDEAWMQAEIVRSVQEDRNEVDQFIRQTNLNAHPDAASSAATAATSAAAAPSSAETAAPPRYPSAEPDADEMYESELRERARDMLYDADAADEGPHPHLRTPPPHARSPHAMEAEDAHDEDEEDDEHDEDFDPFAEENIEAMSDDDDGEDDDSDEDIDAEFDLDGADVDALEHMGIPGEDAAPEELVNFLGLVQGPDNDVAELRHAMVAAAEHGGEEYAAAQRRVLERVEEEARRIARQLRMALQHARAQRARRLVARRRREVAGQEAGHRDHADRDEVEVEDAMSDPEGEDQPAAPSTEMEDQVPRVADDGEPVGIRCQVTRSEVDSAWVTEVINVKVSSDSTGDESSMCMFHPCSHHVLFRRLCS